MKEDSATGNIDSNHQQYHEHASDANDDKPTSGEGDYPANMYQHEKQGTVWLNMYNSYVNKAIVIVKSLRFLLQQQFLMLVLCKLQWLG